MIPKSSLFSAMVISSAFYGECDAFCPNHALALARTARPTYQARESSPSFDKEDTDIGYRSVGDYVGGLHGGKYQFDDNLLGITARNYDKSVIFGDVVDRGEIHREKLAAADKDEITTRPRWSLRPLSSVTAETLLVAAGQQAFVTIGNDESSWETFFVDFERPSPCGTLDMSRTVVDGALSSMPQHGKLAPRGGSGGYSAVWSVTIGITEESLLLIQSEDVYLVVRTEADAWAWRLGAPF